MERKNSQLWNCRVAQLLEYHRGFPVGVLETHSTAVPVTARTNHKITTARAAQSVQQQRPNLRGAISPLVFVHRHVKVMGGLAGLEKPDAMTYTWWASIHVNGEREPRALFIYSSLSLCGAYVAAHRRDTCLKDQVTCAPH